MTPREARRLRRILYAGALLRALGVGLIAVLVALYTARLGLTAAQIGVILSCALWGAALASAVTLLLGPRLAPRTLLVALTAVPAGCAVVFLATDAFALLATAAFVGMFNVNGRDHAVDADPETALRGANAKFERRFAYIERALASQGRTAEAASLEEMDALWNEAKATE